MGRTDPPANVALSALSALTTLAAFSAELRHFVVRKWSMCTGNGMVERETAAVKSAALEITAFTHISR
jgi:hypothetical protein